MTQVISHWPLTRTNVAAYWAQPFGARLRNGIRCSGFSTGFQPVTRILCEFALQLLFPSQPLFVGIIYLLQPKVKLKSNDSQMVEEYTQTDKYKYGTAEDLGTLLEFASAHLAEIDAAKADNEGSKADNSDG